MTEDQQIIPETLVENPTKEELVNLASTKHLSLSELMQQWSQMAKVHEEKKRNKQCSQCQSGNLKQIYGYSRHGYGNSSAQEELIGWHCLDCGFEYAPLRGLYLDQQGFEDFKRIMKQPMTI